MFGAFILLVAFVSLRVDFYLKATRRVCPRAGVFILGQYLQGEVISLDR